MATQHTDEHRGLKKFLSERSWHSLDTDAVLSGIESAQDGITEEEVLRRREIFGRNEFTTEREKGLLVRVYEQLKSPLTVVLLLSFIATLALQEYVDAIVIAAALTVAVVVGIIQEGKASRAFAVLSKSQVHTAIVVRAGEKHQVPSPELVPGDVVVIEGGMQVPADLRLIDTKKLSINESALTGEWQSVRKDPEAVGVGTPLADMTCMAFKGTSVAEGYGLGVVVATGDYTEMGTLAADLSNVEEEKTPLQHEMAQVSRVMLILIIALVVGIFLVGLFRGEALQQMLLTAIAIAVASIPEGLPAAVTIVLAIGMEALLKRGGLVRNLLAAETLGSTTYVLTDKTGTLTEAKMAIDRAVLRTRTRDRDDMVSEHAAEERFVLDTALCASNAFLDRHENGEAALVIRGEPIERAILELAQQLGISVSGESMRGMRTDYLPFSSKNRFAAGLAPHEDRYRITVNGAPEYVLDAAQHVYTEGAAEAMTKKDRTMFTEAIARETERGKRLIGIAYRDTDDAVLPEETEDILTDLVFVGLLVFHDPVRDGISEEIAGVQRAGATVLLVTGDNPETALAVAREVGIAREHEIALTGSDIAELGDDELYEALRTVHVFARVLPRQKMRLASVLQRRGEIVAMTGDGINDAPALQKANIGVSIGSGTEVAKEASDLVLVKDSFATIYAAIEEGRRIIANLRKIVGYLLSTSLSEATLIIVALLVGAPIPILPAQILWGNIIEEGLMSVAYAFEPNDKDAMREKPQDIHEEGILSGEMLRFTLLVIAILSVLLGGFYFIVSSIGVTLTEMRSLMFLAISLDSLFIAFSFRSLRSPAWRTPLHTNIFFAVSFIISAVLLALAVTVPLMQYVLSYEPLPLWAIGAAFVYGLLALLFIEIGKWVFFRDAQVRAS